MLYIRVDMNTVIATGHVMRCIAIAEAAKCSGEDTTFLLADEQAVEMLKERGFSYLVLHTKWADMESELPIIKRVIEERKIKALLIDSYQVTETYLETLSKMVKTLYLDDLNMFDYPVYSLICYANYWKKFSYDERYTHTKLYLGPGYAPLRKEFSDCPPKGIKPQVKNLLLLSGGTDSYDVLARLLEQLEISKYWRIDVICGRYYIKQEELRRRYAKKKNVCIHGPVSDMKHYMDVADVAVSAGGTTLYELCACGTPTISYAIADNQLDNVKQFQEDGMIDYAGDVRREDAVGHIVGLLNRYHNDKHLREVRAEKMQKFVDGKGAARIAQVLQELEK